jgi:hypothetical protein
VPDRYRYLIALAAFGVLMGAGILAGQWFAAGPALPAPAVAVAPSPTDPNRLRLLVAGNTGAVGATARHTAEAAHRAGSTWGMDAILLLGDLIDPLGPEDVDDPRFDERLGPWAFGPPVYWVFGDRDSAAGLDFRRPAWLLARAARTPPFVTRTTTWSWEAAGVLVVGIGADRRDPAWIDAQVRRSSATTRVLAVHALSVLEADAYCGRFDWVLQAEPATLAWNERCNTGWLTSGAASQVESPPAEALFSSDQPGFLHLDLGPDGGWVRAVAADGALLFSAFRAKNGEVRLPEGHILRAAP